MSSYIYASFLQLELKLGLITTQRKKKLYYNHNNLTLNFFLNETI